MGVRCLNQFLKKRCKEPAIQKCGFCQLSGETIAIDTSIYMYKVLETFPDDAMFTAYWEYFVTVLVSYSIQPIFVFDGIPPSEKFHILWQRNEKKLWAEHELEAHQNHLSEDSVLQLRRQCIRVRKSHFIRLKEILTSKNIVWIQAHGEADVELASLAMTGRAHFILSDDMDMFIYGCSHVLRDLNWQNQTVTLYHTPSILKELNMTQDNFREIMVLASCDFFSADTQQPCIGLYQSLQCYNHYQRSVPVYQRVQYPFRDWLDKRQILTDYSKYIKQVQMFTIRPAVACIRD